MAHRLAQSIKLFAVIAPLFVAAQEPTEPAPRELDNGVVACVNSERISKHDVEGRMGDFYLKLVDGKRRLLELGRFDEKNQQEWEQLYIREFQTALRELVRERLMLQYAKNEKLTIDELELKKRVEDARKNPLFKGVTEAEILKMFRDRLLLRTFKAHHFQFDQPTKREVEQYYQEKINDYQRGAGIKVRIIRVDRIITIPFTDPPKSKVRENPSAYQRIEELRKNIEQYGASFAQTAKESSDDQATKANGGLIPNGKNPKDLFVEPESLNPEVAKAVRGLEIGKVSPIFSIGPNEAIVLVEARREAGPAPLDDDLYARIFEGLSDQKSRKLEDEWFRKALQRDLIVHYAGEEAKPKRLGEEFFFPGEQKPTETKQ